MYDDFDRLAQIALQPLEGFRDEDWTKFRGPLARNATYAINLRGVCKLSRGPICGSTRIEFALRSIRANWDVRQFEIGVVKQHTNERDLVIAPIVFNYRHRKSGHVWDGHVTARIWINPDGTVEEIHECHDRNGLVAFLNIVEPELVAAIVDKRRSPRREARKPSEILPLDSPQPFV